MKERLMNSELKMTFIDAVTALMFCHLSAGTE